MASPPARQRDDPVELRLSATFPVFTERCTSGHIPRRNPKQPVVRGQSRPLTLALPLNLRRSSQILFYGNTVSTSGSLTTSLQFQGQRLDSQSAV